MGQVSAGARWPTSGELLHQATWHGSSRDQQEILAMRFFLRMCFMPKKIVSISFPGSHIFLIISIYFWLKATFIYCIYTVYLLGVAINIICDQIVIWIEYPMENHESTAGRWALRLTLLVDHGVCCPLGVALGRRPVRKPWRNWYNWYL